VLSHTLLNDVRDVLQRWGQLLHLVVAKSDVVGNVALVTAAVEGFLELGLGVFVFLFLV
jgi:hypothetical protein